MFIIIFLLKLILLLKMLK